MKIKERKVSNDEKIYKCPAIFSMFNSAQDLPGLDGMKLLAIKSTGPVRTFSTTIIIEAARVVAAWWAVISSARVLFLATSETSLFTSGLDLICSTGWWV